MALRYSLDRLDLADRVETAVGGALAMGLRTGDLGGRATTSDMGDAILAQLCQ